MKTIFSSHCQNDWYEKVGAKKLVNSTRYFHPEIELQVMGDNIISEIKSKYPWSNWYTFDPLVAEYYLDTYDLIVHIDADSIITGKLEELLVGDFDIAGVRNNNDISRTTNQPGLMGSPVPTGCDFISQSLNAGLIASTSVSFWQEFKQRNYDHGPAGPGLGFGEQDEFNAIAWSGKYKTKILDPKDSDVYYGVSQQECIPGEPIESSWRALYIKDSQLYCRDKKVKVIHHASGHFLPKLQYQNWVTSEVKDFLDTITN